MLINSSKMTTSLQCWHKAFNSFVRGFRGETSWGLIDGSTFHAGVATGMATKNWKMAEDEARTVFDKEKAGKLLLPGEELLEEEHWGIVKRMLQCYRESYAAEDYTIIMPEARFAVDLENTRHNDPFTHWHEWDNTGVGGWVEKWNHSRFINWQDPVEVDCQDENGRRTHFYYKGERLPYRQDKMDMEKYLGGQVMSPHHASLSMYLDSDQANVEQYCTSELYCKDRTCLCYQPHTLRGITDAIVMWKGTVWLHEHKTVSMLSQTFWDEFLLDIQPTIYLFGVWKATKLRPRGFIINAMVKPSEKMVANWQSKSKWGPKKSLEDYIKYERQAFSRTEEDILRIEQQLVANCNDWVRRWVHRDWPMSNVKGICTMYNRLCDYHGLCMAHDNPQEIQAYQDEQLVQIQRRKEALSAL